MSRFIYFLTLFLVFIGSTLAGVDVVNTPTGNIARGASIPITWTYTPGNATAGVLRVVDNSTQNSKTIDDKLNLATQSYQWTVDVVPGVYYFALNDETGDKYSGQFTVVQGSAPPSGSAAPAAPSQTQSRATSVPAAPAATNTPPASSSQPQPQPQPQPQSAKQPAAAQSTPAGNTTPSAGKSTSAPSANTAASFTGSSFSGYKLLFSLIVVAAAMVHFA